MVEESPEELAHDLFFERAFAGHALGRTILGTEKAIRRLPRKLLVDYFNRQYRPERMVFSVAGDISHETAKRALAPLGRKRAWPGREKQQPAVRQGGAAAFERPRWSAGRWWVSRPAAEQVHLVWGVEGPHNTSRDRFAAFLLNVHLGGGMSSSLFQEIREKNGLAYTVYSSLTPFHETGVFSVYAATGMEQARLCLELIRANSLKLTRDLLKREELAMIRDNLKGSILLSADSMESRMTSLARNHFVFGRHVPIEEVIREVDQVTAEDVRRVARRLFLDESKQAVLFLGPRPSARLQRQLGVNVLK